MRIYSKATFWQSLLLLRGVHARTWRNIVTYHELFPQDAFIPLELELEFSEAPSATPNAPTHYPTPKLPTRTDPPARMPDREATKEPTTAAPTVYPYSPNVPPLFPPRSYFNYDMRRNSIYGPGHPEFIHTDQGFVIKYQNNGWETTRVPDDFYWSEFDTPGHGAWAGVLAGRDPEANQCGNVGMQSPIDVRMSGVACVEHHQIRTRPGDFRVAGSNVERRIESNKLRLVYDRRPCSDISDTVCSEPDPPNADFPNGWGGFADVLHVDFKVPAEHRINGEVFDAEMQIYHLHAGRRRVAAVSSVMRVDPDGHNYYLQTAIDAFQHEYDVHKARCDDKMRRGRKLVSEFQVNVMYGNKEESAETIETEQVTEDMSYYERWGEYSTQFDDPEFVAKGEDHARRMQSAVWHPHHPMLIPTYWFYGYDGSLTEPPCSEFVSWFIMDTPMIISPAQLEQMKTILFTHVDSDCRKTSAHYAESVARPIQETAGRQVWRCTEADFPPDSERED